MGQKPLMPPSRFQSLSTGRAKRRMPPFAVPAIILILLIGFIVFLSTIDTEVPTTRMEQDVTNDLPKS